MKWFGLRLAFLEEISTERSTTFSGQLWCQWTRAVAKVFYCVEIVGSKQDGPHRALLVPSWQFWWVFLRLILLIWGERRMSSVAAVVDVKGMIILYLPADARIISTLSLRFNFNCFFCDCNDVISYYTRKLQCFSCLDIILSPVWFTLDCQCALKCHHHVWHTKWDGSDYPLNAITFVC